MRIRAPKGLVVAWQCGVRRHVSYIESVAIGGFFIATKQPLPLRSSISLLMDVPMGEVRARAIVRRVAPSKGMGVEVLAMNPEDRARLNGFLQLLRDQV